VEICGDGELVGREAMAGGCDDNDTDDGDGCSGSCTVEDGWFCTEAPSVCANTCGNGAIDGGEECDDGNGDAGDGCNACAVEQGYRCDASEPSVCDDIDECDEGLDNCHAVATCTNSVGSFDCECGVGYRGVPRGPNRGK
jgi:cysteine-rich repeat protein